MKIALAIIALVVAALIVPFFFPDIGREAGVDAERNLPWQVTADGQGASAVFGLRPGSSTLGEAMRALGDGIEVAIIAAPKETGSLEGYYAQVKLGFVLARMILTVDAPETVISAMRERALKAQPMESATRKITLHPDDRAAAEALPVRAIAVIPTVNLDEATVIARFGPPGERIAVSDKRVHLLYPKLGLDVVVDADGKELLQYVAPRDFERLRGPLMAATPESPAR